MNLKEILNLTKEEIQITIKGNQNIEIDGLNLCNRETEKNSILSYAVNANFADNVNKNKSVMALITAENEHGFDDIIGSRSGCVIYCKYPEDFFYQVHEALYNNTDFYQKFEFKSKIGTNSNIHPSAIIEQGVVIGNNVTVGPNSVVRSGSIMDDNVTIGCCTVIGSEGFQVIRFANKLPLHVSHAGRCHICRDVYISDNCCVANSLFEGETYVGVGVKIDNCVHVGHNSYIGDEAVLTAGAILSGTSIIKERAWVGPNSSILNKVVVGSDSLVGIGSVVTRNVEPGTVVYGSPAKNHHK